MNSQTIESRDNMVHGGGRKTKIRLYIVILVTLCPVICYISRLNLSLAIVAMIEDSSTPLNKQDNGESTYNLTNNNSTNSVLTCPMPQNYYSQDHNHDQSNGTLQSAGPKYNWTNEQAAMIQGAFFWTYVGCQIPVARAAEIWGPKWVLALAGSGSAIFSLLAPLAADAGPLVLTMTRLGLGACQTALYPASYIVYTRWLPSSERSLALPLLYMGAYIGSIISSSLTGYLCESTWGWPSVFYLSGIICAIWTVCWCAVSANEPATHRLVSQSELAHILQSNNNHENNVSTSTSGNKSPDWRKILTSLPVLSFVCVFFASMWSFSVVMLMLPSYLNFILHIPVFVNGIINSTIFALFCVASPLVGFISNLMVEKRALGLRRSQQRKLFESLALLGQTICFAAIPWVGCNETLILTVLFIQIVFYSLVNGGEVHIPSELSLDFAGTIYAVANTVSMTSGFLVPMVHGWIVSNRNARDQWNVFWYATSAISASGGLIFLIFGQVESIDFNRSSTTPDSVSLSGDDNKKHQNGKATVDSPLIIS